MTKMIYQKLLVPLLTIIVLSNVISADDNEVLEPSFVVDYENDTFLMDGQPFRFIAGSFDYFRALPETWQRKLRTMRAAGLNAVTTSVEWSLHQRVNFERYYFWEDIANLERFIQLAQEEDLYVIIKAGPYISADRDMGGFPYWLLTKYPEIELRTSDENYKTEVNIWFNELLPKIVPYLYGNGGPIIMVQMENQYGSFEACDLPYREWLRDLMQSYIMEKAVLFTTDSPSMIECGRVDGVFTTIAFGPTADPEEFWNKLRIFQTNGPLVNSQYYIGGLTHWQENMSRVDTQEVTNTLVEMLDQGANVNFYMFHGGTNFGFKNGANTDSDGHYKADITSYDYDAPMDEAGDPTDKYISIRTTIGGYLPLPNISIPDPVPKKNYGPLQLQACGNIFSNSGKGDLAGGGSLDDNPLTFEELNTDFGLVLYETTLQDNQTNPAELHIPEIRDRAYVYMDGQYIGLISRENQTDGLAISPQSGSILQILVENQGRINYGVANDFKGILSEVLLDGVPLNLWFMSTYSFNSNYGMELFIEKSQYSDVPQSDLTPSKGPILYIGELYIEQDELGDTYLDTTGWGKGIAFINGFNLGRYWPVVGPQITLYVPQELLNAETNTVYLLEYEMAPESGEIVFSDVPILDG